MIRKALAILALGAFVALAGMAEAGKGNKAQGGKGKITKDMVFKSLDKDSDGYLSTEELKGLAQSKADVKKVFEQLDTDKDGKISKAEFEGAPKRTDTPKKKNK